MIGTVTSWIEERGFGFVSAGKDEIFVHATAFKKAGLDVPKIGDRVSFEVEADPRDGRPRAINLSPAIGGRG